MAALAHILTQVGIISAIEEHVQFAHVRFGTYDTVDFVLVLFCSALSGERTLASFSERLVPFQQIYLLLFRCQRLPSRSALSRFLAALDEPTVEALRRQFQIDLLARKPLLPSPAGMWDRQDQHWAVVDVDGTRQPARQRALPTQETLPEPHRRLTQVCEVRRATLDANEEKWSERAPLSFKLTPNNGWAPLGRRAMENCVPYGSRIRRASRSGMSVPSGSPAWDILPPFGLGV